MGFKLSFVRILTLAVLLLGASPSHAGLKSICGKILESLGVVPASSRAPEMRIPNPEELQSLWRSLDDFWSKELAARGVDNRPARLILYENQIQSPCGLLVNSRSGPVYLPNSHCAFLDLSFIPEAQTKYGLSSQLSFYYILAHEYAHHVTHMADMLKWVLFPPKGFLSSDVRVISVMNELTADAMAGYFLGRFGGEELMQPELVAVLANCAFVVGDDRIKSQVGTHGTGRERRAWMHKGLHAKSLDELSAFRDPELLKRLSPEGRHWVARIPLFGSWGI